MLKASMGDVYVLGIKLIYLKGEFTSAAPIPKYPPIPRYLPILILPIPQIVDIFAYFDTFRYIFWKSYS